MPDELDDLLALAIDAALGASALLLEGLGQARVAVATKSSLSDVVTEFDHRAEALIADRLLGARPGDGLVGEEGSSRPSTSGVRWIVDPLDGTVNYLYGHPGFSVSIAAEVEGTLAVGVVDDPLAEDTFAAVAGGGATRGGRPITLGPPPALEAALVATGFSYRPEVRQQQAVTLTRVLPRVRDIRRVGSAALDLCSVACGRVDAFYEELLNPWDYAAGTVIAREAGATVTDGEGGEPSSRLCVAAAAPLHDQLLALLGPLDRA